MTADILNQLAEAVVDGDDDLIEELAQKILDEGTVDPYDAIVNGLARGMAIVSDNTRKEKPLYLTCSLPLEQCMQAWISSLLP